MLKKIGIGPILLVSAIIFWLLLLYFSFHTIDIRLQWPQKQPVLLPQLRDISLTLFIASVFFYYRRRSERKSGLNFIQLLWSGFVTGAFLVVGLILVNLSIPIVDSNNIFFDVNDPDRPFVNAFYHINLLFVTLFAAKLFYTFRRMILYQKTKMLQIAWNVFEYMTLATLVLNVFDVDFFSDTFIEIFGGVAIFALILSVNVKWVAYLNFKQKLKSIGIILALLLVIGTFIQYVFDQHRLYGWILEVNLVSKTFFIVSFAFISIYAVSSLLVIIFHLPTSSVFEQKFGEVLNFQKLSQSVKMGGSEDEVFELLLDGSMSTVFADAGWIESNLEKKGKIKTSDNIEKSEIKELQLILEDAAPKEIKESFIIKNLQKHDFISAFRSILVVPLQTYSKTIGYLYLVKKVRDGFDKEIIEVLSTFVGQASVTIENTRLIREAIESERIKEELKIARDVQRSLLPTQLSNNGKISMAAISESAKEVGGDYYDAYHYSEDDVAVVIADVSGHGTKAAFHMAQIKGIFHSLMEIDVPPIDFMKMANSAVSRCLERNSFVTMSLFRINLNSKEIDFSRAGHCPTLFYSKKIKKASYLEGKGLGLGILRDNNYESHIKNEKLTYEDGDVILLYTDGIVEAKNAAGEEFEYERLRKNFQKNASKRPAQIIDELKKEMNEFCGSEALKDDYTLLVIKF